MLSAVGLGEQYTDEDGKPALRLTNKGAQLGRVVALAGDDAKPAVMHDALL